MPKALHVFNRGLAVGLPVDANDPSSLNPLRVALHTPAHLRPPTRH